MRTVALATLVMEMKVLSQTAQQVPLPVLRMMPTTLLLSSVVFEDILIHAELTCSCSYIAAIIITCNH